MTEWLAELNPLAVESLSKTDAVEAYARLHLRFVHMPPFWEATGAWPAC